jgi:glycosyltransferase involved in cell wall biosynthesis
MKKIILFCNDDAHFYQHLLPIALHATGQGFQIKILTNIDKYKEKIESHGLCVIPVKIKRGNLNPFIELILLFQIIKIISKEQPDIIHNFTIKPIIYGSIAGTICKTSRILNNFLGMGYLFINDNFVPRFIRKILCITLSILGKYKNMQYIVQNADDRKLILDLKIANPKQVITQCSVGVDTRNFLRLPEKNGKIIFALVARMLIDKGVYEFIEAAKLLHSKGVKAEFWLVGSPDKQNSASIDENLLLEHHKQNYIKYLGYQSNIKKIWEEAHVAVLPSYREGLSRSLLEAGAYGRAIITTDAPGGRELITNNVNGLLVPIKDSENLAKAMESLVKNKTLRDKLSKAIRQDVIKNYDSEFIVKKIISLWN